MNIVREIDNRRITSVFRRPVAPENILALYITLKPLYLFPSGLPQISDFLLVTYAVYLLFRTRGKIHFPYRTDKAVFTLIGLVAYQLFVNTVWTVVTGENLLAVILFYIFNLIAFSCSLLLAGIVPLNALKRGILNGCLLSAVLAFVGLYIGGYSVRSSSFFNNPNQLGYHGIMLLSLFFLCIEHANTWKKVLIPLLSIWLIIASASKAALIGAFLLLVIYLFFVNKSKSIWARIIQVFLLTLVFAAVYMLLFSNDYRLLSNQRIAFMRYRLFNMAAEEDSNLEAGRGYDRIIELGPHILWGMGEGAFYRFSTMTGSEAHSTFAAMITSYGLIGAIWLLIVFCRVILSRNMKITLYNLATMTGLALYGVSHNGIRNTLLWIFMGIMILSNSEGTQHNNSLEE